MKRIGLICLALVLSLGTLGVGYAMWDKTVYVNGTVETGEVNMYFSDPGSSDDPGDLDPLHPDLPVYEEKDVAKTETWIDPNDDQLLHIVITDGYPYYRVAVHVSAWNNGTVPVKLQGIINNNALDCITIDPSDGIGEQVDPGDHRNYTIYVTVLQCAEELSDYYFTVELYFVQWNEYTPPGP